MKKWAVRIGVAVVALVIVALLIVYFSLNSIVRSEVETQSTASLNVPTTLATADLAVFGGSVSLSDLEIGSPPSFSAPHTFTLGGIAVSVHYGELTAAPIHIARISIQNPVLFIEQNNLKLNLQALMDQISQTPKTSAGSPKPPIKLIIDELDLDNAQVIFLPGLPGLAAQIPVTIPSLTLKNIGNAAGNGNGAAIKEVVMQTATALAGKAGDSAQLPPELKLLLSNGLGSISGQLGGEFNKQFHDLAGSIANVVPADLTKSLGDKGVKDIGGQVGQQIQGLFGSGNKK